MATSNRVVTTLPQAASNPGPWFVELLMACRMGAESTVKKLLSRDGVDPNAQDEHGQAPLHLACSRGHESVVKLLVGAGADPNAKNNNGDTPLHWASHIGHEAIVKFLLDTGVDPNPKTSAGDTALHSASRGGNDLIAKSLLAVGADANAKNSDGDTPLHRACVGGCDSTVKVLLAGGADPNTKNNYGNTPLHETCSWNINASVAKVLLAGGAGPNIRNDHGLTPLDAQYGYPRQRADMQAILSTPFNAPVFRVIRGEIVKMRSEMVGGLQAPMLALMVATLPRPGVDSPLHPLHMAFHAEDISRLLLESDL